LRDGLFDIAFDQERSSMGFVKELPRGVHIISERDLMIQIGINISVI
jgi:hypothetical protein